MGSCWTKDKQINMIDIQQNPVQKRGTQTIDSVQPIKISDEKKRQIHFFSFLSQSLRQIKKIPFSHPISEGKQFKTIEQTKKNDTILLQCQNENHEAFSQKFFDDEENHIQQLTEDYFDANPLQIDLTDLSDNINEIESSLKSVELQSNHLYNLQKVENITKYPYSCIGVVYVLMKEQGKQYGFGTGTMIAEDIVLTCKHVVYSQKMKTEGKILQFRLNVNGNYFERYKVQKVYIQNTDELSKQNNNFSKISRDYAILKLEKKVHTKYGYLGIDSKNDNVQINDEFFIAGYPKSTPGEAYMKKTGGKIKNLYRYGIVKHESETYQGHSGSPLIRQISGKYYIVGIHIGKDTCDGRNIALRTNQKFINKINEWLQVNKVELSLNRQDVLLKIEKDEKRMKKIDDKNEYNKEKKQVLKFLKQKKLGQLKNEEMQFFSIIGKEFIKKKVTHLYLSNQKLMELHFQRLFQEDSRNFCRQLVFLDLSFNQIGDRGIKYLRHFEKLQDLNISKNTSITIQGLSYIAKQLKQLRALNVSGIKLNCEIFEKVLFKIKNLEKITMIHCELKLEDEFNASRLLSIRQMDLSYNTLGKKAIKSIRGLKNLITLKLVFCNIGDEGLRDFANGNQNNKIRSLKLRYNKITWQGVQYLQLFKSLVDIDLGNNDIGDNGLQKISKFRYSLLSLDLSNNKIGDEKLSQFSRISKHLSTLNLSNNLISPLGVFNLAQNDFKTLQVLNLKQNDDIDDEAAEMINNSMALFEIKNNKAQNNNELKNIVSSITYRKNKYIEQMSKRISVSKQQVNNKQPKQ